MSSSFDDDDAVPRREVAWRLFAGEFDEADFSYAESDEERAPNYVVTPSGARINRVFVVGVLTEVEDVNDDVVRARIVDPTGAFVVYAGQYQPEALASLEAADTPSFVALTGKARTFEPDDADVVYTSVRPESVNEVDADTRDRWVVRTAEQTLDRVATMAAALDRPERGEELASVLESGGVSPGLASGTALAIDHYGTTEGYLAGLRDLALDAARVVAGDQSEVDAFDLTPDADVEGTVEPAPLDLGESTTVEAAPEPETESDAGGESAGEPQSETPEPGPDAPGEEPVAEGPTARALDDEEPEPAESELEPEPDAEPEPVEADGIDDVAAEVSEPEPEPAEEASQSVESNVGESESAAESESVEDIETDEMQGLTAEERAEVEENFDVGFDTGSDIPDQGETDIETPEPEAASGEADNDDLGDFEDEDDVDDEFAETEEVDDLEDFTEAEYDEPESDAEDAESSPADLDLEDAVIDEMQALDDGNGAPRDDLVRTLAESYDVTEGEIDDAIQSALMSGRCYESGEDHLKAI